MFKDKFQGHALGIRRCTSGAIKNRGAVSASYVHKLLENSITWLAFYWEEGGGRRRA